MGPDRPAVPGGDRALSRMRRGAALPGRPDSGGVERGRRAVVAEELGAAPLAERLRMLIQRARLDLPAADDHQPDPLAALGLTPREADVLKLLAEGLTNRQIGE